jgi:hypothetical protein
MSDDPCPHALAAVEYLVEVGGTLMEVEPNGRVLAEDCRVDVFVTNEGGATR